MAAEGDNEPAGLRRSTRVRRSTATPVRNSYFQSDEEAESVQSSGAEPSADEAFEPERDRKGAGTRLRADLLVKRARKEQNIELKSEDPEAFNAPESSDVAQDSDDSEGSFKRPAAKRRRISSAPSKLKARQSANEQPSATGQFIGAPRARHSHPQLAPGILDFLDDRCPPLIRRRIFDALTLLSALKLVDLFPQVFKTLLDNPFANRQTYYRYGTAIEGHVVGTLVNGRFRAKKTGSCRLRLPYYAAVAQIPRIVCPQLENELVRQ